MIQPFIPKEIPDMPDCYGVTLEFHDGKKFELEISWHKVFENIGCLEILTFEDEWKLYPLTAIRCIHFDKRWTKIVELEKERKQKDNATT